MSLASQKLDLTPEGLYAYFVKLAEASGLDMSADGSEVEDHASPSVARRGLAAAQMLMAIREVLGDPAPARPAASAPAGGDSADAEALLAEKDAELAQAYAENDRLLVQGMEMAKKISSLNGKVEIMQRQIERLYNKNEMQRTLQTIETKKLSAVEQLGEEGEGSGENGSADNGADSGAALDAADSTPNAENPAPKPPAPKKSLNKELADELQIEAAARAPREEKSE